MKVWHKAILWSGAASTVLSIVLFGDGIALVHTSYPPVNFSALWLFCPSVFLFVLGGVLVVRSRIAKSDSK
jgi:hypothetical protein